MTESRIAYYRVSTSTQSIESQRDAMGGGFDLEFADEGVNGAVLAAERPGFASLLQAVDVLLKGSKQAVSVHVYAVDRLGRDALDVQATVRRLIDRGVAVEVKGLGRIAKGVGELILAVLAQVADMERHRITERTQAGRTTAREHLARTGRTHKGKASLGRPFQANPTAVAAWKTASGATYEATRLHFNLSLSTVKRYCAA